MSQAEVDELGRAGDDPRLWTAEELVAAERDQCRASAERLRGGRFAREPGGWRTAEPRARGIQQSAPKIDHDRQTGWRQRCNIDRLGEPRHAVVARMHLQHQREIVVVVDGAPVIIDPGSVRRAHVDEASSGL